MTLKNNRALLLLYYVKLCASFQSHPYIQTWNLMDDLEKQKRTSPKQHQALCIISASYVNSNWSYGPETAKLGLIFVILTFDLWPWPFAWASLLSLVITENFLMIRWSCHGNIVKKVWWMDGQTDGLSHLKSCLVACKSIIFKSNEMHYFDKNWWINGSHKKHNFIFAIASNIFTNLARNNSPLVDQFGTIQISHIPSHH